MLIERNRLFPNSDEETGYHLLRQLGYDLVAADSPNSFLEDRPTTNLIRQVLGASITV